MQQHPIRATDRSAPAARAVPAAITSGRIIGAVFGLVFFGIGLTVIGFMWLGSDEFGSPPAFFKIVASFIALAFVAMGGSLAASAIFGGRMLAQRSAGLEQNTDAAQSEASAMQFTSSPNTPAGYACPHCGGTLAEKSDVSPMGDTKCAFCGQWFNVHGRS